MTNKITEDGIVRFEVNLDKADSTKVTFESEEMRQLFRNKHDNIFKLIIVFTSELCSTLGDSQNETDMFWTIALNDLEKCFKQIKK